MRRALVRAALGPLAERASVTLGDLAVVFAAIDGLSAGRQHFAADAELTQIKNEIRDLDELRSDYERLRIAYDLSRTIGTELEYRIALPDGALPFEAFLKAAQAGYEDQNRTQ